MLWYSSDSNSLASLGHNHEGPIEGASEAPLTSQHYCIEGFKGAHNWAPIIQKDASLSDSRCKLFQSGQNSAKNSELSAQSLCSPVMFWGTAPRGSTLKEAGEPTSTSVGGERQLFTSAILLAMEVA